MSEAGELKLFLVTAVAFLRAPKRFGAEWSERRLRALNPLAFALNAVGVTF